MDFIRDHLKISGENVRVATIFHYHDMSHFQTAVSCIDVKNC